MTKPQAKVHRMQFVLTLFYVTILLVPLLTFFFTWYSSFDMLVAQEMELQSMVARTNLQMLAFSLEYADSYADSLLGLTAMQSFLSSSGSPSSAFVSHVMSLHNSYPHLDDMNGLLLDSFVYSRRSGSIVNQTSCFQKPERFYDSMFRISDDSFAQWKQKVLEPEKPMVFLASEDGGHTVLYSRNFSWQAWNGGRIVFTLNGDRLQSLLDASSEEYETVVLALSTDDGRLLCGSGDTEGVLDELSAHGTSEGIWTLSRKDDESLVMCSARLDSYGLVLYVGIPKAFFSGAALRLAANGMRFTLPVLLCGLLLLLWLLRRSHRPLRNSLAAVAPSDAPETMNPFLYLSDSICLMNDESRLQAARLQSSRMEMQEALLSMLVYNKNNSDFPLEAKLSACGFRFDGDLLAGMILTLRDANTGEQLPIAEHTHMMILDMLKERAVGLQYVKMDSADQMLLLACLEEGTQQTVWDDLRRLCWDLSQNLNCDVRVFVGQPCEDAEHLYLSFRSAREGMRAYSAGDDCLVFQGSRSSALRYDYTDSDARYLLQMVSNGNDEAVQAHLEDIRARNRSRGPLSPLNRQLLYGQMLHTLLEAGLEEPLDMRFSGNLTDIAPDEFFALLSQAYAGLCAQKQREIRTDQEQRMQAVLACIAESCGRYDLSISDIALKFGVSERRLSAMIHQACGSSFAAYVEECRIAKAIELLRTTELSVEKIAQTVGYCNDKTFRRALKRRTGRLPTDFRPAMSRTGTAYRAPRDGLTNEGEA